MERIQNRYGTDTEHIQNGYRMDTERIQNGYRTDTERIQNGYRMDTERIREWKWNGYRTDKGMEMEWIQNAFRSAFSVRLLLSGTVFPEVYQRIEFITGITSKIKYLESKDECQQATSLAK